MSLKRVLGMMLASRMSGRGRGGLGRGLGSAAVLGGLGRRGMGRKMGLAAMGYMAWQAYRDHQARTGGPAGAGAGTAAGARPGPAAGGLGGIGDMIRDVADRFTGGAVSGGATPGGGMGVGKGVGMGGGMGASPSGAVRGGGQAGGHDDPDTAGFGDDERAAADIFSENKALLLLRAMIAAAHSDGALTPDERRRIMGDIDNAGGDAEDRRTMEREIANPRPVDELVGQIHDHETAQEFYLASRAAIDGGTEHNRAYLASLRKRLAITDEEAAEVEDMAT